MKISYGRLKDILSFDISPEVCADYLTNCGLEVEGIETYESIKGGLQGLVIGEVLTCVPHPNSDHLHITDVNVGGGLPLHIVCGAPNVAAGQKVVVATVGTTLYCDEKPVTIKKSRLRGEPSEGMICAEAEIGVGTSRDGIMVLDEKAVPGTPAASYFKVETDVIFEIGLTPNRNDAISHFGVARDLYATLTMNDRACSIPILPNVSGIKYNAGNSFRIDVTVENKKDCRRYTSLVFDNVHVADSPEWLQNRLKAVGIRPVNNIVDITQFIMQEIGQPLHAFDADRIRGDKVIVRNLPDDTPFVTLDGNEIRLNREDLMICDAEGGMCIAGVYGGLDSGITRQTTKVFLESAYFNPTTIRKTVKRHGLMTDASFRFERGCDPSITVYAIECAAELIMKLTGANPISEIMDFYPDKIEPAQIELFFSKVNQVAGEEIDRQTVSKILLLLGMEVHMVDEDQLLVTVPQNKADVTRSIDLIEEILRIYGYNNIAASQMLTCRLFEDANRDVAHEMQVNMSNYLTDCGFYEVMNNSLTKADYARHFEFIPENETVKLLNPLGSDTGVLRQTLLLQGLENIVRNLNNKNPNLRLFEFGKTYHLDPDAAKDADVTVRYREKHILALFVTGKDGNDYWNHKAECLDFFYLKNIVTNLLTKQDFPISQSDRNAGGDNGIFSEHLDFYYENERIVTMGMVHSDILHYFDLEKPVFYAEIDLVALENHRRCGIEYRPVPVFPSVRRDLALVVDRDVRYETLENIAYKYGSSLIREISLFDVYEGDRIAADKKSYALAFVLQSPHKTLTEKDINREMNRLMEVYRREVGAVIRS